MKKIGVEKGLIDVVDYLTREGYSVETLSENLENNTSRFDDLDAIVTSGINTDMMGFSDTTTKVPVINASGLTAEEIKKMIDQKAVK